MAESPNQPAGLSTPSLWTGLFRHPLAAVVVSFALTGLIGTSLSNHMADLRQKESDAARLRDLRRNAVLDLSRRMSERLTRMEMLIAAIDRHATPQVVADFKKLHDEAEAKWLLGRAETLLLAREILGESDYEAFRVDLENRLAKKRVHPLRDCLERASIQVAAGGDGAAVLRESRAAELLNELRAGSEALVDGLYDLASVSQLEASDPQAIKMRQRVRQQIEKACP
ncbi:MAG: hypothetical protein K8S99_01095 [Planctomycetes bacterium]|nr:hypothetical protein [Planctomycetota bacterium]